MGHEVTVVTPDDSLDNRIEISTEDGVIVVRVRTGRIRHSIRAVRAFRELRLSSIIWNAAKHYFEMHPCDLVVYYSPTIFWSELVNNLKVMHRCGSYQILRDLFPQWLLDTGLLKRYGLAYWYFRRHELRLYSVSDVIGVQSPANLEYFSKSPLQGRYKVEVLFNWTNIDQRKGPSGEWRHKLGLQNKVVFIYGGMLGIPQDVDNLVRLARNLSDEKHCFFLLVGEGSEVARIRREIDRRGMTNMMLHPAVSQDEYLNIVAECDVGLITLRRDLKTHNLPGKMLSYMQMEKPILASINPGNDLSTILVAHRAGFTCDNGEDELLCESARRLAHDSALRQIMGKNGHRLLAEKFDVSVAARQITSHFSSS
jgi:glycosyltransferase involved in cell wall biosynthesis